MMELPAFEYSIRILLVGEDKDAEELLSDTLMAVGYNMIMVDSVDEAGKALNESRIDLVIADPGRSVGSWQEFLDRAKKELKIPIIFITDRDDPRKSNYIEMGIDSVLTRPFRIEKVEELIAATLLDYDKSSIIVEKKSKKIIIVDDDDAMLSILSNSLLILGYDVVLARSGEKALEEFYRSKFDMLITDYMMPGLSGKELITAVKKIQPDIPAVIITGYPLAYPPGVARSEGIDAYLLKPFRINQLMDVISGLLPDDK
ncbi:MAG: response regulator [Candidatus Zixiibacteriota bacterium]|nr:MAG: response regulator [candidate division Zixibacteria bacterium]